MNYAFCYLCGGKVVEEQEDHTERGRCTQCGQTFYKNPKPAVEVVLIADDNRALVVTRARDPFKGKYDLPGGFLDPQETFEEAIVRELQEEINLTTSDFGPLVYLGAINVAYPWGKEEHRVASIRFTARLLHQTSLKPTDDVASIEFKQLDDLTPDMFAWSEQYTGVKDALAYWGKA